MGSSRANWVLKTPLLKNLMSLWWGPGVARGSQVKLENSADMEEGRTERKRKFEAKSSKQWWGGWIKARISFEKWHLFWEHINIIGISGSSFIFQVMAIHFKTDANKNYYQKRKEKPWLREVKWLARVSGLEIKSPDSQARAPPTLSTLCFPIYNPIVSLKNS